MEEIENCSSATKKKSKLYLDNLQQKENAALLTPDAVNSHLHYNLSK